VRPDALSRLDGNWLAQGSVLVWILLGVSVAAWLLILRKTVDLIALRRAGARWLEDVVRAIGKGERRLAVDRLGDERTQLARVVSDGLQLSEHRKDFEKRTEPALQREIKDLRGDLRVIAVLGMIAPLLGLLGTVLGMVRAFAGLASSGSAAESLSAGISEALISTQTGLVVAVPVLIAHKVLGSRIDRYARFSERTVVQVANALPRAVRSPSCPPPSATEVVGV
jgi:biopolymer transport protein ExbB